MTYATWKIEIKTTVGGCQSTSHKKSSCFGSLWQCRQCKKWVCYADGYANGTEEDELCDACWAENNPISAENLTDTLKDSTI